MLIVLPQKFKELILWHWPCIVKALNMIASDPDDLLCLFLGLNSLCNDLFSKRFDDLDKIEHYHIGIL